MKKLLFAIFSIGLLFSSCGNDESPVIEPNYTLYDKSEILGNQTGNLSISLSLNNGTPYEQSAGTSFIASADDNVLNLFVTSPLEIGGPIRTLNFKRTADDKQYTFSVEPYSLSDKKGGEIPAYITDWFKSYTLSKVSIKNLSCTDAKYDRESKVISMTFIGPIELYSVDKSTNIEKKVADDMIKFTFTDLVKN